jgi:hypothetical protein
MYQCKGNSDPPVNLNNDVSDTMWMLRPTSLEAMVDSMMKSHKVAEFRCVLAAVDEKKGTTNCVCTWVDQFHACFVLKNDPRVKTPNVNSVVKSVSVYGIDEEPYAAGKSRHSSFRHMQTELTLLLHRARKENFCDFTVRQRDLRLLARAVCWLTQRFELSKKRRASPLSSIQL